MNAVDLFCGVGGMSLGFESAGVNVAIAIDSDPNHVNAYNANRLNGVAKCMTVESFIANIDSFNLPEVDLVFGGPPCQGFSYAGKRDKNDERNLGIKYFCKAVELLRPKVFVMENVVGLKQDIYKDDLNDAFGALSELGYAWSLWILDANDFGVPQKRKRLFFVGFVSEDSFSFFRDVMCKGFNKNNFNVRDAIYDLREGRVDGLISEYVDFLNSVFEPKLKFESKQIPANYIVDGFETTTHSKEVIERFRKTPPGRRDSVSRFMRLAWDGLSPTLRAGTSSSRGSFMAARPIHPDGERCITVREAARLHSYPDWFEFTKTKWYGFMQVGNSVPPLMANYLALNICSSLRVNT